MDIAMRLLADARSDDFERAASERRRGSLIERCQRRILGLFTLEQRCTPTRPA